MNVVGSDREILKSSSVDAETCVRVYAVVVGVLNTNVWLVEG